MQTCNASAELSQAGKIYIAVRADDAWVPIHHIKCKIHHV